jgi:hypothetical protein
MRNSLLLLTAVLLSSSLLAQSEKWSTVNYKMAVDDALLQSTDVLRDISRTTGCSIEDLTGVLDHFGPGALIGVSSALTGEDKYLTPEAYFVRLNKLKCGDNPRYNIVHIKFDALSRSKVTSDLAGDTTFVTVPVVQWFVGIASDVARSYADKTIKAIVYAYYIDRGVVVGKIKRIVVGPTTKIEA